MVLFRPVNLEGHIRATWTWIDRELVFDAQSTAKVVSGDSQDKQKTENKAAHVTAAHVTAVHVTAVHATAAHVRRGEL